MGNCYIGVRRKQERQILSDAKKRDHLTKDPWTEMCPLKVLNKPQTSFIQSDVHRSLLASKEPKHGCWHCLHMDLFRGEKNKCKNSC